MLTIKGAFDNIDHKFFSNQGELISRKVKAMAKAG